MKLSQRIQSVLEWLRRVALEPQSELTRWQRAARFCYDLGRFGARQLRQDRAAQMAAALSFRTLFGILPVMIVTSLVLRSMRGAERSRDRLAAFFDRMGLDEIHIAVATHIVRNTDVHMVLVKILDERPVAFHQVGFGLAENSEPGEAAAEQALGFERPPVTRLAHSGPDVEGLSGMVRPGRELLSLLLQTRGLE